MKRFTVPVLVLALSAFMVVSSCKKEKEPDPAPPTTTTGGTTGSTTGSTTSTPTPVDEVPKKQMALMLDISGTWCPPCGSYGLPAFRNTYSQRKDKVIAFSLHASDEFSNTPGNTISQDETYKSPYVPRLAVDNNLKYPSGAPSDSNYAANELKAIIDQNTSATPLVNSFIKKVYKDGDVVITTKTKFFDAANGEYYIGVYVLEDGLQANQKFVDGSTRKITHDHVLRNCPTAAFGDPLITGAVTKDQEFSKEFTMYVATNWVKENLSFVAIIWEKKMINGVPRWQYVNGNIIH